MSRPYAGHFALCALALGACSTKLTFEKPDPGWERMQVQPRANAYAPSDFFADGKVLQAPPEGAIARDHVVGDPARSRGLDSSGRFVDAIPVHIDLAAVARGHNRFEIFCAPCHGIAGDGESVVATKMSIRKPPSLHESKYRAYPAGEIYQVVSEGFGLMPSYADALSIDDRWAVVAYVRALQLSQHAVAASLPDAVRRDLAREAP